MESGYKKLIAWQKSFDLTLDVYKLTAGFPRHEQFGLTSQLRRAVSSIPANIAEGYCRKTTKEFIQFLYIALGSSAEAETFMELIGRLNYTEKVQVGDIVRQIIEVRKMLWTLIEKLSSKP